MKHLMCIYDLFDANQKIHVVDINTGTIQQVGTVLTADLSKTLAGLCSELEVDDIKIYGCKNGCEKLIKDIQEDLKIKYNKNNINIEVI